MLTRLSSLKYDKVTAEFSNSVTGLEEKVKNIKFSENKSKIDSYIEERLLQINEISPKAAVFDAWSEIETSAHNLGFSKGQAIKRLHIADLYNFLEENKHLRKEEIVIINDLRIARNKASHLPDQFITYYDGLKYIKTAVKVIRVLKNIENTILKQK